MSGLLGKSSADIVVVGAGAAGLMAAIAAGRSARASGLNPRIVALDSAKTLGAKILVAGGGRCNVTHHAVDDKAYAGSTRPAIRKVLRSFTVADTTRFFSELGVELKREDTGKLFPTTDRARDVLDALLNAARDAGVEILHPWRVGAVERSGEGFAVRECSETGRDRGRDSCQEVGRDSKGGDAPARSIRASRVVLATGGLSLPKTGSDGHGHRMARLLGHTVTALVTPALVPLVLDGSHAARRVSGVTVPATVSVHAGTGKRVASFTNSTLCTHFGLSGPSVLDASRYYLDTRHADAGAKLVLNWLPEESVETVDELLASEASAGERASVATRIHRLGLPTSLARELTASAGVDPTLPVHRLTRDARRAVARAVCADEAPVAGDRGYKFAEVTAGGVPLAEIDLKTMESRVSPGLHLCGEVCDVDGRIGGFNFQWAWASGHLAGIAAATGFAGA